MFLISCNLSGILPIAVCSKASHNIKSCRALVFFVIFVIYQSPCGRGMCPVTNNILRMMIVIRMSVDSEAIKEIGKCVPVKIKVFGSTFGFGIRQTDIGEAVIMDRNVIMDTIRDHCELLSAIAGMLVSPLPDFV
jgi:hypothetical protein